MSSAANGRPDLSQFHREGWAVVRLDVSADTLDRVRAAIVEVWERRAAAPGRDSGVAFFDRMRPELPRMHREHAAIATFVRARLLAELAGQLLGPDVDLSWNQAHAKAGGDDPRTAIPWHQDGHYAAFDGAPPFSCWIALTTATVENGAMWGAPNADRAMRPHAWDETLEYFRCDVDEATAFPIELSVGEALLFDTRFPHKSLPNRTREPRIGLSLSFAAAGARLAGSKTYFGDGVPVLRGGVWVDALFDDYAASAREGRAPAAHAALDVLRELEQRFPDARGETSARLDAFVSASAMPGVERDDALSRLLAPPLDERTVLGDLVGARANVGQVLTEAHAAWKRGDVDATRRLLARVIELDPAHDGARQALAEVEKRAAGTRR